MYNTLTINKYSSEKDITMLLFCCCFYNIVREEDFKENPSYPYNDFVELCIKHDIKKYARLLYTYCLNSLSEIDDKQSKIKEKEYSIFRQAEIDLSEALLPFLSKKSNQKILIIKENGVESGRIANDEIINTITNGLINRYKEKKYHKLMKHGDAQYIISKNLDKKWIEYYCAKNNISKMVYQTQLKADPLFAARTIKDLEEYIIFFHKKDIDFEYLKIKLRALKVHPKATRKLGAPPKNDILANLAEKISYIIRFRKFISQDKYTSIREMPIQNAECRAIHDCLKFFGMIENKKDTGFYTASSTSYSNYIRTTINNYRKKRKSKYPYESRELTENSLNKIYNTFQNSDKSLSFKYIEGEDMTQLMNIDFLSESET